MREDLLAIGNDYWIEDDAGDKVFKVNGKVARLRDTWILEDAAGTEVARIKETKLTVRDNIRIELDDGEVHVKKGLVGIRDRFHIDVAGGKDLKAHGNVPDHEYQIERGGDTVAEISKKSGATTESRYGPATTPALVLAITVAIDALARD